MFLYLSFIPKKGISDVNIEKYQTNQNIHSTIVCSDLSSEYKYENCLKQVCVSSNAVLLKTKPDDSSDSIGIINYGDCLDLQGRDIGLSGGWSSVCLFGDTFYIKTCYLSEEMLFMDENTEPLIIINSDEVYDIPDITSVKHSYNKSHRFILKRFNSEWREITDGIDTFYIPVNESELTSITNTDDDIYINERYLPVINKAYEMLGKPYRHTISNDATDCIGLTKICFAEIGVELPWTMEQMNYGESVSLEDLQPGDVLFWSSFGSTTPSHATIYVGDGMMIHASGIKTGIVKSSVYNYINYGGNLLTIRRI